MFAQMVEIKSLKKKLSDTLEQSIQDMTQEKTFNLLPEANEIRQNIMQNVIAFERLMNEFESQKFAKE